MDPEKQREIASMGGKAAHQQGVAHEFDHREAVEAGRKGGEAVSQDRAHMAQIGRLGGEHSHGGQSASRSMASQGSGEKEGHDRAQSESGYGEEARAFLSEEIRHHVKDKGMPQDQAVAAAMSEARRKGYQVPRENEE